MKTPNKKDKRGKRRQKTQNFIKRQVKIAKSAGLKIANPHKYAKKHAMDCGRPNCGLCGNPRKLYKEKTIQEQRWDQEPEDE